MNLIQKIQNSQSFYKLKSNEKHYYILPSNNQQFYLYIENKTVSIFDNNLKQKNCKLMDERLTIFDKCLLQVERFGNKDNYIYLIIDILVKNDTIIKQKFSVRRTILECLLNNNFEFHQKSIGRIIISPIFDISEYYNFKYIFRHNSKYWTSCPSFLLVDNMNNNKENKSFTFSEDKVIRKKIVKISKTQLYEVYDSENTDYLGYLHINSLELAEQLRESFKDCDVQYFDCNFNTIFNKYEIKNLKS